MVTKDVEKDVMFPIESSNKIETFSTLNISFPWGYRGKNINCHYKHIGIILYLQKFLTIH